MSSGPDLYLVCKSCGAEVSPYITECPYCGTRIQKRAPKLDRGGVPKASKRAKRSRPQLPRLRPNEIPGIRADRRAWAVWLLVLVPVLVTLAVKTHPEWLTALTLGAIALFGWLLEKRHGWWAPLLVYLVCGVGGAYVAAAVFDESIVRGANGAALGMLAAWTMRDVLGRRHGREDDSDLLGVLAIAAVLVLLPLATTEASGIAGIVGGVAGILLGLVLARLPER